MRLIGFERADFVAKDTGAAVTGCNVYLSRPVVAERGKGQAVERVYVTDARAAENGIDLNSLVGKDVVVNYTRRGKIQSITLA